MRFQWLARILCLLVAQWNFRDGVGLLLPTQEGKNIWPRARGLLFVGVISGPGYFTRRAECRNTWMRIPIVKHGVVEVKFFVGHPDPEKVNHTQRKRLKEEMRTYGDMIQVPTFDSRGNLSNKTLEYFRWVGLHRKNIYFAMKLDDDTYPRLDLILPVLWHHKLKKKHHAIPGKLEHFVVLGYFHTCAYPRRAGRSAEDPETYRPDWFPKYPQGSGYVLSKDLVQHLAVKHYDVHGANLINNEDANIGVWINRDLHLGRLRSRDVNWVELRSHIHGCVVGDLLSMNLAPGEMGCMWENRLQEKEDWCCKDATIVSRRPSLLQYAWKRPFNCTEHHHFVG